MRRRKGWKLRKKLAFAASSGFLSGAIHDRNAADTLADRSNLRIIAENWIACCKNASEGLSAHVLSLLGMRDSVLSLPARLCVPCPWIRGVRAPKGPAFTYNFDFDL